jgi:hypothetical protein
MKPFSLEPNMVTMRGVFYPTGHMFVMFPTEKDARDAERRLVQDGFDDNEVCLLTPAEIQEKVGATIKGDDIALPSPGTEAETVRHYAELARQGHHALMIHAPSASQTERVMNVLKGSPISYGQKYRHLVIEDLVE